MAIKTNKVKSIMILRFFPFLAWFNDYGPARFKAGAAASLTLTLVLIPQRMA
jgi:MFS superfamily sulfate permease-like transporter